MRNGELREKLRKWAISNECTRECINGLLKILIDEGNDLPKDSRTLLNTMNSIPSLVKCGGDYIYLGIKKGIEKKIKLHNYSENSIYLKFNIDGLPLFKSSATQLWPILATFGCFEPFLVALFCGSSKPTSLEDYLKDFVEELGGLLADGVLVNNTFYSVHIFSFICDAPARSYLKCIINHTGYYSCERCTIMGAWKSGRIVFCDEEQGVVPRTDAKFKANEYFSLVGKCHQKCETPLKKLNFNLIGGFSLDYMHLVCLGVVRRLLYFIKGSIKGTNLGKLSTGMLDLVSTRLLEFNGKLPSEFVRQPRSLVELDRWKATELRSFLMYTGLVALKGIISQRAYKHFLSLSIAVRFLCESNHTKRTQCIDAARDLITYFVYNAEEHYGSLFCVYNVHNLLHLCDDVQNYQTSLHDVSAFPFENYLQKLKKFVRGRHNPLVQVCKRLDELDGLVHNSK